MDTLLKHINHLLLADGFASVDGIGVFMLHRRDASVDTDGSILPPVHYVSFDASAPADSSDIINSIERSQGISHDEARAIAETSAHKLQAALAHGIGVPVGDFGTLSASSDTGELSFEPSQLSWGTRLMIKPIEIKAETSAAAYDEEAEALRRREIFARSLRRTASSAAAIAIIAIIAFVMSQLPRRESTPPQVASMGIETLQTKIQPEPMLDLPGRSQASESALVLILNTPADGSAPAKVRYRSNEPAPAAAEPQPDRYCLVVASLASKAEAEKFIAAHSSSAMPLSLLAEGNHWRVYALSASSLALLSSAASDAGIYDVYPSAWAYRRK